MSVLILDTSVFIKLKGTKVGTKVNEVLDRYQGFEIFTSEMSCFEFIRGCNNHREVEKAIALLAMCKRITIDTNILKHATHYFRVLAQYIKDDGKRAISTNQLSDSDIIIGASALMYDALLFTTDRNDFPAPFFDEISVDAIDTNQKIYMLKADAELFLNELDKILQK